MPFAQFLVGKKTYLVATMMIVDALYRILTGGEGSLLANSWELLNGMGLAALRAGVTNK